MCDRDRIDISGKSVVPENARKKGQGALSSFGCLDTRRAVMRAYERYRYNLFKEKYENYGR